MESKIIIALIFFVYVAHWIVCFVCEAKRVLAEYEESQFHIEQRTVRIVGAEDEEVSLGKDNIYSVPPQKIGL